MLDEITIVVIGGNGGNGAVSFRREKYVPRGGPDGGDGGRGGNVVVEASPAIYVLDGLRRRRVVRAGRGGNGTRAKRHGRDGGDEVLEVPAGTVVWRTGGGKERRLADLAEPGQRVMVARGGRGGRGNARMATSVRRAPRIAERGLVGERVSLRLELRLLAQVGLVGLPNAGKSSLLRAVSSARPEVGAYPFTTLEPHLGVASVGYDRLIVADIPGLIEGAHKGAGLGVSFLRHVERTRVLVHVVDASSADPVGDLRAVRGELEAFGRGLVEKRWIVALNKIDLPGVAGLAQALAAQLRKRGSEAFLVSALTGEGAQELMRALVEKVREEDQRAAERARAEARETVLRPRVRRAFEVRRLDGVFQVVGEHPERAVEQLGVESGEARAEVGRRLRRMGVLAALRRAGIAPGDRVRIGQAVLEWPL